MKSPAGMRARFGGVRRVIFRPGATCVIVREEGTVAPTGQYSLQFAAMRLEQFAMERMQSTYENQVDFNMSESGVHPLRLGELVDDAASRDALLNEALRYSQSNGTAALRSSIAALYPGSTVDHIQVTNGGSEANCITTWDLLEPGGEGGLMVPNYLQA